MKGRGKLKKSLFAWFGVCIAQKGKFWVINQVFQASMTDQSITWESGQTCISRGDQPAEEAMLNRMTNRQGLEQTGGGGEAGLDMRSSEVTTMIASIDYCP